MSDELIVLGEVILGNSVGKQVLKGRELFIIRFVPNVISHEANRERLVGVGVRNIPTSTNVDEAVTTKL